jgi:Protein of unknown function (DUF1553)/Protein of unknown function (DUF1549)/Planctomycete cytochrome C
LPAIPPPEDASLRAASLFRLCLISSALAASRLSAAEPARVDFQNDILPLFQKHCYQCHDANKQKSGFRLDAKVEALKGGDSGKPAIVPGQSGKSELIRRVTSADVDEAMPPQGKAEPLSAAHVKLLRDWIDAGAEWPDTVAAGDNTKHWAFKAPVRPAVPGIRNSIFDIRNPIDNFILARLEKEGLKPSPQADKITLVRRLSLDLTGLPPTPEEVDDFVKDNSTDAYAKLVERLLASPHYGERWARLWLDAARYADSDGFEKDKSRQVFFYRDWVINAFNRDLPYNQFIIDQIAGDLLPNATQDEKVATGYLRNSMLNEEGGIDPEQFRMEAMFDRMDAIGKGILGLTIQCAQCHNHKFDPLTQADYYRMFAFLNNCHEANIAVYTPAEQMKRAELFRQIKMVEDDLRHKNSDWLQRMRDWEARVKNDQPAWQVARPEVDAFGDQKNYLLDDGSILVQGYAPTKHTTTYTVKVDLPRVTAVRLELLNDPNLPLGGPGRSIYGMFGLTEFRVSAGPADKPGQMKDVKVVKATADVNPADKELEPIFDDKSKKQRITGRVEYAIDGKDETAWGIDAGPGRRNVPRKAVFVFEQPIEFPKGAVLTFKLTQNHGGWNSDDNQNNNLGRFRFSVTGDAGPVTPSRPAVGMLAGSAPLARVPYPGPVADPLPARVRELLSVPPERRTKADEEAIFGYWRTTVPEWRHANDQVEALWKQHPAGSSQLVALPREQPRDTHILKRGDFLKPADPVDPGVPSFLHPLPKDAPPDRLTFARWLADPKSPTMARSFVNRIWQAYFGTGLVSTSEDLGTQSEPPSHPELLDWLAVEFMEQGWRVKDLHRLIVNSATYRQSSKVSPELVARDPENRLLARGPRFRVEAEGVRDIALSASGLLHPQVGGRSVFPPLPGFMVLPPVSYGPKIWPEDKGPERYRRALYTFRYRSLPYPVLQTFDAPNGDFACVRRPRSNTPLQALMTLNEPIFVECAQGLAQKTLAEGGKTDSERLGFAFRRCLSRAPSEAEAAELLKLLAKEQERFSAAGAKPWEVAAADPAHPPQLPEEITPAQAAAWTVVTRVLLNLDETISKE